MCVRLYLDRDCQVSFLTFLAGEMWTATLYYSSRVPSGETRRNIFVSLQKLTFTSRQYCALNAALFCMCVCLDHEICKAAYNSCVGDYTTKTFPIFPGYFRRWEVGRQQQFCSSWRQRPSCSSGYGRISCSERGARQ